VETKLRQIKIEAGLIVAISLAIVLLAPSPVMPATAYEVGSSSTPLTTEDFSSVPQSLVDQANQLAVELFGDYQEKRHNFTSQLLATYLAAKDKDVIIFFNAGGWGWDSVLDSPGWATVIDGMKAELASLGYTTLVVDHKRTSPTLNGCISELMVAAGLYPPKARDLAARVEFLTGNLPQLRVILAGESNGSEMCEGAMGLLPDNQRVYSIQLGPPFWEESTVSERSLVLRSNGDVPDSFSQGGVLTIIRANLEAMFGISQKNPGHIFFYIGAPGHFYSWQYTEVRSQVTEFLRNIWS
jgi:hypothetical protein